jgi:hypothetical protein
MTIRRFNVALACLVCSIALANACAAQPPAPATADTQKQIDALRAQVKAMQQDLDDIKDLLAPLRARMGPSPSSMRFDLGDRPMKGSPAATLTLIELTDYQ